MMGTSPKSIGFKQRQSAGRGAVRALAATAACAAALVVTLTWVEPSLAQGTVSEYAKTPGPAPAPAAPQPQAKPQGPAQAQAPAPKPPAAAKNQAPKAGAGKAPAASSPVGSGSGWQTNVQPSGPQPQTQAQGVMDNATALHKVNTYFNGLKTMNGTFVQVESDNTQKRGRFFIERPGKIRFDYANPSKLHIISDGEYLSIEDHDLGTSDRYPIDSTPFRLLLSKDVDLTRDARILGLMESDSSLIIALEDKLQNAGGQIRLFFDKPNMQLREWIVTDPQGLNTKITISEAEVNKTLPTDLFKFNTEFGVPQFNR